MVVWWLFPPYFVPSDANSRISLRDRTLALRTDKSAPSPGGSSSAKRSDLAAGPTCSARTAPRYGDKGSNEFLCPGCGVLVPVGCPCPLPFGARPMPVPATLRCPPHARALLWALPVRYSWPLCAPTRPTTRSSACSYSSATPTRFVLLPVRYPRPPDARAFPLPVPAACPCPYSSVCSVALLRLRHHATSRAARARA